MDRKGGVKKRRKKVERLTRTKRKERKEDRLTEIKGVLKGKETVTVRRVYCMHVI